MTDEVDNEELVKPKVIANLRFIGDAVFGLLAISGGLMLIYSLYAYFGKGTYDPLILVLGVALIIGGWVQQQFIHGFSVLLDQLFEIRKNTSD